MILAGRRYYELEGPLQRRLGFFLAVATALFVTIGIVTPLSCVPGPLRRTLLGHSGPQRPSEVLNEPALQEDAVEAMAAAWLASGALRCVEVVFVEEDEQVDPLNPRPEPQSLPRNAPRRKRGPSVHIGQIVPLERPAVEIELHEDLSTRTTSKPGARTSEFEILEMVRPVYPQISLWRNQEGLVTLRATVDPAGRVTDVTTISNQADKFCEEVSRRALRDWRFKPMMLHGNAVWFSVVVPFRFSIER